MNPVSSPLLVPIQQKSAPENKSSLQSKTESVIQIAIDISGASAENAHGLGDAAPTFMAGMTRLHTLAKDGNTDAIDMLIQLSAHSDEAIANQAQSQILSLNTALNIPIQIKSAVSESALALYKLQSNRQGDKDRLLTGILYLAGAEASSQNEKSIHTAIQENIALRNPQKKVEPALVDNILNPGRLLPNHEIFNHAKNLKHLQHVENTLSLEGDSSNAQIQTISAQLRSMPVSPSGHSVIEARIHGNNHYITAIFSLGSDGKINCDCLDTHSESMPNAQKQLTERLNAVLPGAVGSITFTQNDALQRNNACGVLNLMLLQHLDETLATPWPVTELSPASPPASAKPTIKSLIDEFSKQLGELNDAEKDAVFSAKRAEIVAHWPAQTPDGPAVKSSFLFEGDNGSSVELMDDKQ
jgi:hypothetical protein